MIFILKLLTLKRCLLLAAEFLLKNSLIKIIFCLKLNQALIKIYKKLYRKIKI